MFFLSFLLLFLSIVLEIHILNTRQNSSVFLHSGRVLFHRYMSLYLPFSVINSRNAGLFTECQESQYDKIYFYCNTEPDLNHSPVLDIAYTQSIPIWKACSLNGHNKLKDVGGELRQKGQSNKNTCPVQMARFVVELRFNLDFSRFRSF